MDNKKKKELEKIKEDAENTVSLIKNVASMLDEKKFEKADAELAELKKKVDRNSILTSVLYGLIILSWYLIYTMFLN